MVRDMAGLKGKLYVGMTFTVLILSTVVSAIVSHFMRGGAK